MTQRYYPQDDDTIVGITVDATKFAELGRLLAAASTVVHEILELHSATLTGLTMAAESAVLADLRSASRDAAVFERYVGELA